MTTSQQKIESLQLGSLVSLIVFAMLFMTLFMGLFVLRDSNASNWPPPSFALFPLTKPIVSTSLIILSSLTLYLSQRALQTTNRIQAATMYAWVTIVLGFAFLVTQYLFWSELNYHGFLVETGAFASFVHAMTWVHAAHIILGLLFLGAYLWVCRQSKRSPNTIPTDQQRAKLNFYTSFWHLLTIVWFLILFGLFVPWKS